MSKSEVGDINKNNQQLVRKTMVAGTDHNAKIWVVRCVHCGNEYGANNTDFWERKCPNMLCQKGAPGLAVPN